MKKEYKWKRCCAKEIIEQWKKTPDIVYAIWNCKTCSHFIGLTLTSRENQDLFIKEYN